ncbi:MAG: Integral rane protein [Sphingomonas bacterium]|uniref:DMT family transporter n=1 Tax=Sphingomonas bacterium TaxID=1895847 RepID=UPI0026267293|nr:DMT family transporter [Sphingomonas bacterium]MDB5706108.1 Integral rane protein [Sphingomonas bacterium]
MEPRISSQGQNRGFGVQDLIVVAAMNILWGFNIIAVKMAVSAIAPLTAGFLRQVLVFIVCMGSLRIVRGRMRALTALGILSGGAFYVATNLSLAITHNVGALAIAGQLGVPFSLILAIIVFRERIHLPRIIGIALSVGGIGLLVFDPTMVNEIPGLALTALASFIWAICMLIQRRLIGVPVLTIYAWVGLWGTITLGAVAVIAEPEAMRSIPSLPLGTLGWVAFSAIGSTVLGQGSMSWLLQRHPVSIVTPLTLAAPVIAVFATGWYFDTPPTMLMLAGGAIAMIGVAIVTIRTARAGDTP